jgi:hypothetical protein
VGWVGLGWVCWLFFFEWCLAISKCVRPLGCMCMWVHCVGWVVSTWLLFVLHSDGCPARCMCKCGRVWQSIPPRSIPPPPQTTIYIYIYHIFNICTHIHTHNIHPCMHAPLTKSQITHTQKTHAHTHTHTTKHSRQRVHGDGGGAATPEPQGAYCETE